MSRDFLVFDNKSTLDFGVYLYSTTTLNSSSRDKDAQSVIGRNGDIITDNGRLENVPLTYVGLIRDDMLQNVQALKGFFLSRVGYCKLQDTFNSDEYRLAVFDEGFEVTHDREFSMAKFEMKFSCKPQRFLVSGDEEISISSTAQTILNQTYFDSNPFFTVVGNGTIIVANEDVTYTMALAGTSGTYYIDCENLDCYQVTDGEYVNLNSCITLTDTLGDYPHFPTLAGNKESTITASGFTSVLMRPRWWTV